MTVKTTVSEILSRLEAMADRRIRDEMLPRYGITATKAHGVAMKPIQTLAKSYGRDHALGEALWATGWYEARMVAIYVSDPAALTAAQMDRWCRDFDNWGTCDTACFALFDRSPHAWGRVERWATRKGEYQRRAAFALMASLALHAKTLPDAEFLARLPLVEAAATDERNFVKKGVSWALRSVGRKPGARRAASIALAERLAASPDAAARWVGRDALRDLSRKPRG